MGVTPYRTPRSVQKRHTLMVHIPSNKIHSLDPESRAVEVGLLDAEIGTLKADNRSLRAINKILEQEKKDLETEIDKLQSELGELRKESAGAK